MQRVVSNSSPLIHLAKINKLELLKKQFQSISIPESVYKECVLEGKGREESKLISEANWINVLKPKDKRLVSLLRADLDEGESDAISLAMEIGADLILLDDSEAREKARHLGLKITGIIGILLQEKKGGGISSLKDTFKELRETGFRISPAMESKILLEAGEVL